MPKSILRKQWAQNPFRVRAAKLICICLLSVAGARSQQVYIRPGKVWNDQSGRPINAHGGGILLFEGRYYWYGEIKSGPTWRVPDIKSWEDYRVNAGGISCYSSVDLIHWTYEGNALAPDRKDSANDLYAGRVIERPKVIYNRTTQQFVMWMHIDRADYGFARAGVAVSQRPEGPFRYLHSIRPNGQMARDLTLFQDDDRKAYLVYASENNLTMEICLLSADYLDPTDQYHRILINAHREAPALFKYGKKYFLISSLCTGWDPNEPLYAEADSLFGTWTIRDNPCRGPDADSGYHAQVNFVLPVEGKSNRFIFMADRWVKTNLSDSRYVWLPLQMEEGKPVVVWKDAWIP